MQWKELKEEFICHQFQRLDCCRTSLKLLRFLLTGLDKLPQEQQTLACIPWCKPKCLSLINKHGPVLSWALFLSLSLVLLSKHYVNLHICCKYNTQWMSQVIITPQNSLKALSRWCFYSHYKKYFNIKEIAWKSFKSTIKLFPFYTHLEVH